MEISLEKYVVPNFNPFPMTGLIFISIREREDC